MLWLYAIPTKAMVALISGAFVVISWASLLLLGPVLRVALRRNSGTNAWRDLHAGRVHRNGVTVSANITAPCGRRLSP